jgi:hypothetical protein
MPAVAVASLAWFGEFCFLLSGLGGKRSKKSNKRRANRNHPIAIFRMIPPNMLVGAAVAWRFLLSVPIFFALRRANVAKPTAITTTKPSNTQNRIG